MGYNHLETLFSINNLAIILFSVENYKKAELLFSRVTKGYEKTLGTDHPDTIKAFKNLVSVRNSLQN